MSVTTESIRELVGRAKGGHRGALGRLTTHVESGGPEADEIAGLTGPPDSDAHVVGITGAPGAGKSSLTGQLLAVLLAAGRSPAVLAVNPSSPLTGGAILGDRVRMDGVSEGAFVRLILQDAAVRGLVEAPEAPSKRDRHVGESILQCTDGLPRRGHGKIALHSYRGFGMTATMTVKGQVTIPRDVRDALGLEPGAQLDFEVEGNHIVVHPVVMVRVSDAWMGHPEVVAELNASFDEVEGGETEGAVEFDKFLERLDADA